MKKSTNSGEVASVRMPIAHWCSWIDDASSRDGPGKPDVRFVEPLLRRRLGPLAKMMLHVAHTCAQEVRGARLVFASRHGELTYTLAMLRELAADGAPSPTMFSLSVHNAAAGIFSILRQDSAPATAVAAGDDTLGHALIECFCQLERFPDQPVLLVYGDKPLPPEYCEFAEHPERDVAIAVLFSRGASRTLTVGSSAAGSEPPSGLAQSDAFLQHLSEGGAVRWTGTQRTWAWH